LDIVGTAVANRLQNSFKITGTDHRIIEILGLRPSNRLPVSYYKRVIPLVWILLILFQLYFDFA
jgi:hypothetical protein